MISSAKLRTHGPKIVGGFLGMMTAVSTDFRWLDYTWCYLMCAGCPCIAAIWVYREHAFFKKRSTNYQISSVLGILSLALLSLGYFLRSLFLVGTFFSYHLSLALILSGFGLNLVGALLSATKRGSDGKQRINKAASQSL